MHSIKHIIFILNCLLIIALCGCNLANSDVQSEYVNVSEVEQKIEDEQLNINIDGFEYDDKPYNIMKLNYTLDGDYFYKLSYPYKKISLRSGRVQYVCQIPGCAHDEITSPGCISYQYFGSPVATSSGIYYTDGNKVMLFSGESSMTVLENDFYTDYEQEAYPDSKSGISAVVIKDNIMYITGPTFFFTYNLDTQERTEPYAISDSFLMSLCIGDEYLYYSTDSLEFYMYNLEEKTPQKLDDKVGQVCIKDGKNPVKIRLHDDETPQNSVHIISTGSMNHVFIVDDNDILYIIEDGSTEFKEIEIGEG